MQNSVASYVVNITVAILFKSDKWGTGCSSWSLSFSICLCCFSSLCQRIYGMYTLINQCTVLECILYRPSSNGNKTNSTTPRPDVLYEPDYSWLKIPLYIIGPVHLILAIWMIVEYFLINLPHFRLPEFVHTLLWVVYSNLIRQSDALWWSNALYFMYACIQRKTWIEDSCWLSKADSTGCEHIWAEHHLGAAVSDLLAVVASVSGLLLLYMYATHSVQQWHPSTSVTIGHQKWYSTYNVQEEET